jgi:hypothetical protein
MLKTILKIQNIIRLIVILILCIVFISDFIHSFSNIDTYQHVYVGSSHFWQFTDMSALRISLVLKFLLGLVYFVFILYCLIKNKFNKSLFYFFLIVDILIILYFIFLYFYNVNNI